MSTEENCPLLLTLGAAGHHLVGEPVAPPPLSIEQALSVADRDGRFHRFVCAMVLVTSFCGGMGGGVSPFLMTPVSAEGSFSSWEKSFFASSLFIGMWAGSFVGGVLCDAFGPGLTTASTVIGICIGDLAPSLFPLSIYTFSASRIAVGFSMVICFQAGNTYVAECCPTSLRSIYMSLLHVGIAAGALCSSALALVVAATQWRQLLLLNAVVPLVAAPLVLRFALLNESPRWLLVSGREERCKELLQRVSEKNVEDKKDVAQVVDLSLLSLRPVAIVEKKSDPDGCPDDGGADGKDSGACGVRASWDMASDHAECCRESGCCDVGGGSSSCGSTDRTAIVGRLCQVLHPSLRWTYFVGTMVAFTLNFGNKGLEIWTASYFERLQLPIVARLAAITSTLGKIVGDLISMCASQWLGRLTMLQISFWACAALVVVFVQLGSTPMLLLVTFLLGLCSDVIWCNIYMLLAESFPTSIRSTAFGLVLGLGRTGGVFSSALGGAFQNIESAFLLYAASFALGGVLISFYGHETSNRPLADTL